LVKRKRALPEKEVDAIEKKPRPWWARTDQELIKERYDRFREVYESFKVDVTPEERDQILEEASRRDPRISNLLDMVIVKNEEIEKKGEFLILPIYGSKRGERIASFFRLKTTRRVRLDRFGWEVWDQIDGRKNVREIGIVLRKSFGDSIEPLYPRLAKFLAYLENLKLIVIKGK
jgi:hypothetical protein